MVPFIGMNSPPPGAPKVTRRALLLGAATAGAGGGAWWLLGRDSAAGPAMLDEFGDQNETLPRGRLPAFASAGGPKVEEVYRYALERGEALEHIPCFCGCAKIGHRGNRDCYVKRVNRDGTVTWTSHGAT